MSFLWHGLTEQGAQVPVQVDAQGRVIAVDGTPGVSNWERTGTTLSPAVPGDSVAIGSGNITLNADGSISTPWFVSTNIGAFAFKRPNENQQVSMNSGAESYSLPVSCAIQGINTSTNQNYFAIDYNGTAFFGNDGSNNPNITLSADGSASFRGNITAANVTFRSADPQFYVKKKDADPQYVGPELDLLEEIQRLEALVRYLYETLRIAPPAGWPVWDGNDDVLRQLRK